MSIKLMSAVWDESKTSGSALLLLLALADYADEAGVSWPGIDTLATKIRMSHASVHRLIAELVELGELAKASRAEKGRSNLYVILVSATPDRLRLAEQRVASLGGGIILTPPGVPKCDGGGIIAVTGGGIIAVRPDPSSSVIESSLHDDDIHEHESDPVEALLERGWNAGDADAAAFVTEHGAARILAICEHAEAHKLGAGWIRKNAGTWKPGKNGNGNGNGRPKRRRSIDGQYADIIRH